MSWREPVTFGLPSGLTLATYAWVGVRLRLRDGWVRVFTAVSAAEVALTTLQAWRRTRARRVTPAHGVAMHGVLLPPAPTWALSLTTWSERHRTRTVALVSIAYRALIAAAAAYNAFV